MIVCIGSQSKAKITSIMRAFSRYPELWEEDKSIEYITISGVSCIPKVTGAVMMVLTQIVRKDLYQRK